MRYIATFDIGTTALKGVLLTEQSDFVCEKSVLIETLSNGTQHEQRPCDWYKGFCAVSHAFFESGVSPADIRGIVMSGQMQDLILMDKALEPVGNALLYMDGRAAPQAQEIEKRIGAADIEESTGNSFDGFLPLAKLLWIKQTDPARYQAAHRLVISAKDFVIARLTGAFVTDVTSGATSGLMDIRKKCWNTAWMDALGLDRALLPCLLYADEQAGTVTAHAAAQTGYLPGTPVYAGTGDAGATTLASGIAAKGEFNINLGTSGWVACVSDGVLRRPGVFNLAAMMRGVYINVVPFLNAGSVHKWAVQLLTPEGTQQQKYAQFDALLRRSEAGSHGVMFLPYLAGERFPVMDTDIRGGYAGISSATTKNDLARSALEGVAFSIRQGLESIGRTPTKLTLIGGGAKASVWCQILADVLGYPVLVLQNAEYLPSAAIAASVLLSQGDIPDYAAFTQKLQTSKNCACYQPDPVTALRYNEIYPKYLRLYPALKSLSPS